MIQSDRTRHLKIASESAFRALCGSSGLAATKPEEDENGWDFLIEFPVNRKPGVPLDKQAPAIKCLVQVKSTDDFANLSVPIYVSNLDKLARTTLPTFIVIYDYAGDQHHRGVYFCHIDDERISGIFSKVRTLESEGKTELNHHRTQFAVRAEEKIDDAAAGVVKDFILKCTGENLATYEKQKIKTMEEVGFEDKPIVVRFATSTKIESLVDAMLGIGELHIIEASVSERRFGVEISEHEMKGGILKIDPTPVDSCQICAVISETGEIVEVNARIIAPQIPGLLREHFKVRIVAPGIEATIAGTAEKGDFKINIDPQTAFSFGDLLEIARFSAALCARGSVLEFRKDGRAFAKALMPEIQESKYHQFLASRLDVIDNIIAAGRFRGDIKMRPVDIIEDKEFKWLRLASIQEEQEITWTHDVNIPLHTTDGVVAAVMALRCDTAFLCFFCWWKANFRLEGLNATANISNPKIHRTLLVNEGDEEVLKNRIEEFREFCTKPEKALFFLGPNPARLFEEEGGPLAVEGAADDADCRGTHQELPAAAPPP